MSLCLHAGANKVTRQQLATLPVPRPMGSRHVIRPFIEDVEIVTEALGEVGFKIEDEAYGVKNTPTGDPGQFFGLIEVTMSGDVFRPGESFGLNIGLRGSYDQSLARGLAVGSRVFVCDNLAFSGDIRIGTKQTTFVNERIPSLLRMAVGRIPGMAEHQARRFEAYRNKVIAPLSGDAALVECVRIGVLNPSQIGKAIIEWDEPSHQEHADGGYTAWRLHNAVTEAIKPSNKDRENVLQAWDRTLPFTAFLDKLVGLPAVTLD